MRTLMLFFVLCLFQSCAEFESSDLEASYIHFATPRVNAVIGEGAETHNIKDLWMEMDGDDLGVYPINKTVPFLPENDPTTVFVFPGIKNNGFQTNSVIYPFYNWIELNQSFVPNALDTVTLDFTYRSDTKFSFIEDFEGNHVFTRDQDDDPDSFLIVEQEENGNNVGVLTLTADHPQLGVSNILNYNDIPLTGRPVYLELDYKNNIPFEIGIVGVVSETQDFTNVKIILNPKDDWNKIYIDFTEDVSLSQLDAYRIVFASVFEPDQSGEQKIFIDNVKLVHF